MKKKDNQYLTETQYSNLKRRMPYGFNPDDWENVTLDNRLKEWMSANNMTAQTLSARLNDNGFSFSPSFIKGVETGVTSPPRDFMFALAVVFNASIDDIFFTEAHTEHFISKEFIDISKEYLEIVMDAQLNEIEPADLKIAVELMKKDRKYQSILAELKEIDPADLKITTELIKRFKDPRDT